MSPVTEPSLIINVKKKQKHHANAAVGPANITNQIRHTHTHII